MKAPHNKTVVKPNIFAPSAAPMEPTTEAMPFKPHIKGARPSKALPKRRIPPGNGEPSRTPSGNRSATQNRQRATIGKDNKKSSSVGKSATVRTVNSATPSAHAAVYFGS